jgi:hypothetical protein
VVEIYAERLKSGAWTAISLFHLSLPKMLSGANAFEISDIERMNMGGASAGQDVTWGAHQPGRTMLHALWLPEITIRQVLAAEPKWVGLRTE